MLNRLTLRFADLWPVQCIACIYQRFFVFGIAIGVAATSFLFYIASRP